MENCENAFCILPWVHLNLFPDGNSYLCCHSGSNLYLGNLREHGIAQVWNGPALQRIRAAMLRGERISACKSCYECEKKGIFSPRRNYNRQFKELMPFAKSEVAEDVIAFWDLNGSNACNLSCRICSSGISSTWARELGGRPVSRNILSSLDLSELSGKWLGRARVIRIAGGEPLLCRENQLLLSELRKINRECRIEYLTNLSLWPSTREFQDGSALAAWSGFDDFRVFVSVDALDVKYEYLRYRASFAELLRNFQRLKEQAPRARISIMPTLYNFTAASLPDVHRFFVEKGLIEPWDFNINYLHEPFYYHPSVLPVSLKRETGNAYRCYARELREAGFDGVARQFEEAAMFMGEAEIDGELKLAKSLFFAVTRKIDALRGYSINRVFPELSEERWDSP